MTQSESEKITLLTLLATFLVVVRHGVNLHCHYPQGSPYMQISDAIIAIVKFVHSATAVAIPCFFLLSGYLFFLKLSSLQDIFRKLRSRLRTLLLPFLLWNCLSLIIWGALFFVWNGGREFILTKYDLLSFSWPWLLDNITLHPIIGQFWYIRTLCLFMLATPILFFLLKSRILTFLLLVYLYERWFPMDMGMFTTEGQFFFVLGAALATYKCSFELPGRGYLIIGGLAACWLFLPLHKQGYPEAYPFRIYIFAMLAVLYGMTCQLQQYRWRKQALWLSAFSFLIYALHAPMIGIFNQFTALIIGPKPLVGLLAFFLYPVIVISIITLLGQYMRLKLPFIYGLLTGNRGLSKTFSNSQ